MSLCLSYFSEYRGNLWDEGNPGDRHPLHTLTNCDIWKLGLLSSNGWRKEKVHILWCIWYLRRQSPAAEKSRVNLRLLPFTPVPNGANAGNQGAKAGTRPLAPKTGQPASYH